MLLFAGVLGAQGEVVSTLLLVPQVLVFLLLHHQMLDSLVMPPRSACLCSALPQAVSLPAHFFRGLQVVLACFPKRPGSSRTARVSDVDRQATS